MSILSVNSPLSLQESQLVHILRQHTAFHAGTPGVTPAENRARQNLPAGTNNPAATQGQDSDLSPQNISALLSALQTHQETPLPLDSDGTGLGGKTLADHFTADRQSEVEYLA